MKRLFLFLCAGVVSFLTLNAQERLMLEDSVIVGGISRSMVERVSGADDMKADEKLLFHWSYAELIKDLSREDLSSYTDQELRDLLAYFNTKACRFLASDMFYQTFLENINKAFQSESGQGQHFSTSMKDGSYGVGLRPLFQSILPSLMPAVDEILGEKGKTISNAKSFGLPSSHIDMLKKSAEKVRSRLFDIYRLSAVDYLSKEDLKVAEDFFASALGQKYAEYIKNVGKSADFSSAEFSEPFFAKLGERKINTSALRSSVVQYVSVSSLFPEYFPEVYRPYAELVVGDSGYAGETRDKRPHGKGRLTDKKGVVYEGDFKNGQRHGMITVTKPGKAPVTQFWIDDKYRKEVPVGKDKKGAVPAPYMDGTLKYGYGSVTDDATKASSHGVFIDGLLNGKGKIYKPGHTEEGEFLGGDLVKGTVTLDRNKNEKAVYEGRMGGKCIEGVCTVTTKDESRTETLTGTFYDGYLEGQGNSVVARSNDKTESTGTFAFGKLYGHAIQKRDVVYGSGIHETSVYEGGFYADRYHGEGRLSMSLNDIPSNQAHMSRCNVLLPAFITQKLDVVMDGRFDNGTFVEGKITYSDGSWYEGKFTEIGLVQGNMRRVNIDGSVYQGACADGEPHGAGELYGADGSIIRGEFEYGQPVQVEEPEPDDNKKKNEIHSDELTYEFNNLATGYGKAALIKPAGVKVMVRSNVTSLKAVCKGVFRGETLIEGKVTMSDGNWLEGVFENGVLMEGKGKTVDKYRVVYEGEIKNRFPHGTGKCYYNDGTWFEGKFAWGNRMAGTHYSATGEVIKVYE